MKTIILTLFFTTAALINVGAAIETMDLNKAGFSKLTETQKVDILNEIERVSNKADGVETVEKVSKWVTVGTDLGKGLAGAAKELGVTANEFIKTPVGKLTAALIVWHFMGGTLIHIFGAFAIWIIGPILINGIVVRRISKWETKYGTDGKMISRVRSPLSDDWGVGILFANIGIILLGIATLFTF